jgi:peptide/nickel transport system permease protein
VVRAAMLEALAQDYVRTARAKGISETRVIFVHALRNALIPFITAAGIMAGYQLGGAVVIEQVFALPGLGRLIVGAIDELASNGMVHIALISDGKTRPVPDAVPATPK